MACESAGCEVLTCCNRFLEELNGLLLARKAVTLLVVQPTKLLQDLCVVRISVQYALISILCTVKVLLLFVDMADLKPNVLFRQRRRRRVDDVLEALETMLASRPCEAFWVSDVPLSSDCTSAVACI